MYTITVKVDTTKSINYFERFIQEKSVHTDFVDLIVKTFGNIIDYPENIPVDSIILLKKVNEVEKTLDFALLDEYTNVAELEILDNIKYELGKLIQTLLS